MRNILIFLLSIFLLSCSRKSDNKDQVIFDRIEYFYNLKSVVDSNSWKGFANLKYDLPLVYYTDSVCYVANPTERFINSYKPTLVHDHQVKIYKTTLLDSIPFHMETGITFGDSTADYRCKSPFMNCSSLEITKKTIADVNSTEQWAAMIIHEYFHGFQYRHQSYLNYLEKNIGQIAADSLKCLYISKKWFKESIDKENECLLSALRSNNEQDVKILINSFFQLREERRRYAHKELHIDIKPIEEAFETMEGTARYVEHTLYNRFSSMKPDDNLVKSDISYHSYHSFKNYKIENDPWLYLTNKTTYFYATGFNLARLLDKLHVDYKARLFNEGALSLEQILSEFQR